MVASEEKLKSASLGEKSIRPRGSAGKDPERLAYLVGRGVLGGPIQRKLAWDESVLPGRTNSFPQLFSLLFILPSSPTCLRFRRMISRDGTIRDDVGPSRLCSK